MKTTLKHPLLYIFILGVFLRFYDLGSNPAGFFRDEAAKGYNAYCLLETGKDVDENSWPMFTRELTTYNTAVYSYLTIPFIALFGVKEFAVRFPAALFASLTILTTYWLVVQIFNKKVAFFSALFLSISPWHLVFSRWANQGILLPFFITLGVGCFLRNLQDEKKDYWFYLSFVIFGISIYIYDIAKIFIGPFCLGLILFYLRNTLFNLKKPYKFFIAFVLYTLTIFPSLWHDMTHPQSLSRFARITIFNSSQGSLHIAGEFFHNWLSHYSPQFLFLNGDQNIRHAMPYTGQLYLFELPLILMGIYFLWKAHNKSNWFLLYWLIIFPIPASLTTEGIPHALRSICVIPLFSIFAAIGLVRILESVKIDFSATVESLKQFAFAFFLFLALLNICLPLVAYYRNYAVVSAREFQYGMKEAVEYSESVKANYDNIVVSPSLGFPKIFFLFYTRTLPEEAEQKLSPYKFDMGMQEVETYMGSTTSRNLFLISPPELAELPPKKVILSKDGSPLLKFVENIPTTLSKNSD